MNSLAAIWRRNRLRAVAWALAVGVVWCLFGNSAAASGKTRLMLVDSYHWEYLWSQYTNRGFCEGLLKFGYLDNDAQVTQC